MSQNQIHSVDHLERPFLTLRIIQFPELPHVAYPRATKELCDYEFNYATL